jgi:cell division septum initiation protein DivIVA
MEWVVALRGKKDVETWFRGKLDGLKRELRNAQAEKRRLEERVKRLEEDIEAGEKFYQSQVGGGHAPGGTAAESADGDLRFVGMTIHAAAAAVLAESSRGMHAKQILTKLEAGGKAINSKDPVNVVVSVLSQRKSMFRRTAPNTFKLVKQLETRD